MKYDVLKFTPENLERHINAARNRKATPPRIITTRDKWLDTDTLYLIPNLGIYRVTDHWTYSEHNVLDLAKDFYHLEGFVTPYIFLQELSRIYADANGNLPELCVNGLVEVTSLTTMNFGQALAIARNGHKVTRVSWTGEYLRIYDDKIIVGKGKVGVECASIIKKDVLAEDWILYEGDTA